MTGGLALASRRGGVVPAPVGTPPPATVALAAGDEVVVPVSALTGVPGVPPNAGGAVLSVDAVRSGVMSVRIVAFVGAGGAADVATPIGPIQLPTSAIALKTVTPPDRVGRFAQIGDDVTVPALFSLAPIITDRAARDAFNQAVPGADLASGDVVTSVIVRVTTFFAADGGEVGLEGIVRGATYTKPDGTKRNVGVRLGASNPTSPLLQSGAIPRSAIVLVSRNGTLIAPWQRVG